MRDSEDLLVVSFFWCTVDGGLRDVMISYIKYSVFSLHVCTPKESDIRYLRQRKAY